MALQGTFVADFQSFFTAVEQAEVKLRSFEQGSAKVESSLNRMVDSFSGRRIISEATLMAEAIERSGGVSNLTARELERAGRTASEAAEKMRKLGIEVPPSLTKVTDAAAALHPPLTLADRAAGLLKSSFGQFTLAGLAVQAINKVTGEVGRFIEVGGKLPAVENAFVRLNASVGENTNAMLAAMTEGTKGMVSNYDLMLSANKAFLLGVPVTTESMGELAKTATVLGRAMGKDATSSLNDLITALGRSSPLILDNLGLTVKVGEANEAYAEKLGKSSSQLTESEKKMAFYEATMEAARKKTEELGNQTLTLTEIAGVAWTAVGNRISSTAATMNVGLGAAVTSLSEFGQLIVDTTRWGAAAAVQMAAERAQAEQLAGANRALGESVPLDPLMKYQQQLDDLRASTIALTPEQQAVIAEAIELGQSVTEIATALGVSTTAVNAHAESLKKLKSDQEKLAAAQEELDSVGKGWQGTLARINVEIVEQVKRYLEAGVAQGTLATAYSLTATQVKAIASALQEETRASKEAEQAAEKLEQARKRAIEQASGLWDEYYETLRKMDLSTHNDLLARIDQWKQEQIFAAVAAGTYTEEYYQRIEAAANQMTQAQMVNMDDLRKHSKTYAQEQASEAEATYQYVLAHAQEFTSAFIELKRREADEARQAANNWGSATIETLDQIEKKAIQTQAAMAGLQGPLTWSEAMDLVRQGKGTLSGTIQLPQPDLQPWGRRETGGPVMAGEPYIVGEKRPELFVPSTSGTILPFVPRGGMTVSNHYSISVSTVAGNPHEIARVVKQALVDADLSSGKRLLVS